MAKMVEITCACGCGRKKMVRLSDVKRGWGRFYSKSCKAREQERRTGQHARFRRRQREVEEMDSLEWYNHYGEHPFSSNRLGQ